MTRLFLPLLLIAGVDAFAPEARSFVLPRSTTKSPSTTARAFGVDPSFFHDLPQHMDAIQETLSSFTLADAADMAADVATDAAEVADKTDNGWFGFLTGPTMGLLQIIHSVLVAVGLKSNAWGISIIMLTVLIKVLTFPLTKSQLESTNKMQAMQPAVKEIQAKYQSNPEVMNQKVAEFYQTNEINPLAGCIPSLVQIPIFIGLYRAVLDLAKENKLDEPFLFLPNLEGPTYGADPGSASDWLLKGWVDGVPSLGWDDTISFLILPVFLVISQFVSMQLMQPKTDDPAQQQSNIILKILPIMIGWFSLNVPAALSVYWVVNNIITTAISLVIRNSMKVEAVTPGATAEATAPPPKQIFAPPPEKPAGFGAPQEETRADGVKPITAMDAEIIEKEEVETASEETPTGTGMESTSSSGKNRGSKKRKKKKRKN